MCVSMLQVWILYIDFFKSTIHLAVGYSGKTIDTVLFGHISTVDHWKLKRQ